MSEESLGARIKAERKKRRWSQGRLADELGITDRTVLRWEIKGEMPNNENRLALIEHLGLREEDFQRKPKGQPLEGTTPPIEPAGLEGMLHPKDDFKIYSGRRIYKRYHGHVSRMTYVTVNGRPIKNFGTDTRNPEEQHVFEWGHWGEGASTLAQAILADFFEETYPERGYASSRDYNAPLYATLFKKDFIGRLPNHADDEMEDDSWQITSDQIRRWFATLEERGITRETLLKELYGADYNNRS